MKQRITLITLLLVVAIGLQPILSQTQLGSALNGVAIGDEFGEAVSSSSDGMRVAIGAPGVDAGYVKVLEWDGTNWIQLGSNIAGTTATDALGKSVSLSADGQRVAVGSGSNPGLSFLAGQVRIFEWDDINWVQVGSNINGVFPGDVIGESLALSGDGNRVVIGAPGNGANGGGFAMVYEWDGQNWSQMGISLDGTNENDFFGEKVVISRDGTLIAVGGSRNGPGYVRTFEWNNTEWTQVGSDIIGSTPSDDLGKAISLSSDGSRIAVGVPANPGLSFLAGHVRIFEKEGSDWVQIGASIEGIAPGDLIGRSVSFSGNGNRVAIGAPGNGVNGGGFAMLYEWNGASWNPVGSRIEGTNLNDFLGSDISLSEDGNLVTVGAPNNEEGYAVVYDFSTITSTLDLVEDKDWVPFPNPTKNIVNLPVSENATVSITDCSGRILLQRKINTSAIDISFLPDGIYFIHLQSDQIFRSKQLIKQ